MTDSIPKIFSIFITNFYFIKVHIIYVLYLENMPLNDRPSGILQNFFPMFKSRLVSFGLIPSKENFANGISATDQIVVTNLKLITKLIVRFCLASFRFCISDYSENLFFNSNIMAPHKSIRFAFLIF